tara:strand:- start:74 stop:811 length:738 start_codon:yes stop_codon:yes gene_type:complete
MKTYKIFKNHFGLMEAIKQGWSWPGFFFGVIWCFFKKLWHLGVIIIGIILFLEFFLPEEALWLNSIFIWGSFIYFGTSGNQLRESKLLGLGYEFVGTSNATSPEGAIAMYQKHGDSRSESEKKQQPPTSQSASVQEPTRIEAQKTIVESSVSPIKLEMLTGSLKGMSYSINSTKTIGRGSHNDIVLDEGTISDEHCEISIQDEHCIIKDLNSTNGTFVNGKKIEEIKLEPGAEIKMSSVRIKVVR